MKVTRTRERKDVHFSKTSRSSAQSVREVMTALVWEWAGVGENWARNRKTAVKYRMYGRANRVLGS